MKNVKIINPIIENNLHRTSRDDARTIYKTSDLYLSGFLKAKGLHLVGVEKDCDKIIFIFKGNGERIRGFINGFYNDSRIGVLRYKAALRDLRSLIFHHRKRRGIDESNIV